MTTTLVIRLSSLGDVAILIPVLYSVAIKNPEDKFLLITKKPILPIFINKPSNLEVFPVHTKDKHKGIKGLWKLIKDIEHILSKYISASSGTTELKIADLHNVIRSGWIDFYFRIKGARLAIIDKSRKEKRTLTQRHHKKMAPLKSSLERYRQVFKDLGYDAGLCFSSLFPDKKPKDETWLGIAPFAKHTGKIYPLEQMQQVVRMLGSRPNTKLFLFGGKEEKEDLDDWARHYENTESVSGKLSFSDELLLMNNLDLMISMDSANMHLASLVNTPVVSIWGATHPYSGFYGFNQNPEYAVQIDLQCRPCSVYGDKACFRGDWACLRRISPDMIVERVNTVLKPVCKTCVKAYENENKD